MRPVPLLFLSLLAAQKAGAFEIPGFELVYTAPAETTLTAADLRPPALVWQELFRSARRTIDIEEMYAVSRSGEPLDGVIAALEDAGRRGVKVRFLLESKLLQRVSDAATVERLKHVPGLELRTLDFGKQFGRGGIIHAKFFIVDGARAYVGSQNFDWRSLKHVQELGVRVTDPHIAGQMEAIFEGDWQGPAVRHDPPPLSDAPIRLVASPPDLLPPGVGPSEKEIVRLLARATKEVRVQVMSYSRHGHGQGAYRVIDDALRQAAARGVSVKLLVADWNAGSRAIGDLRALSQVKNIEVRVVSIPAAREGCIPFARVIHAKYAVIDGRIAWIGTSNWEGGYLDDSRNLELVFEHPGWARRVRDLHMQLWGSSYATPLDIQKDYPPVNRECRP